MKNNVKIILAFILGIVAAGSISAYAFIRIQADEIGYNEGTVQDALDELYRQPEPLPANLNLDFNVQAGKISSATTSGGGSYLTTELDIPLIQGKTYYYSNKVGDNIYPMNSFKYNGPGNYTLTAHNSLNCYINDNSIRLVQYSGSWYNIYINVGYLPDDNIVTIENSIKGHIQAF